MSHLIQMREESVMSFPEIGEKLGMTGNNARLIYHKALQKIREHMRTREEWVDYLQKGNGAERTADLVLAALRHGSMIERGQGVPRHEQTVDRRAFKMAYRAFIRGAS